RRHRPFRLYAVAHSQAPAPPCAAARGLAETPKDARPDGGPRPAGSPALAAGRVEPAANVFLTPYGPTARSIHSCDWAVIVPRGPLHYPQDIGPPPLRASIYNPLEG